VGVDIAWVFQPYLACCAAAAALCLYSLMEPMVPSARVRALLAFLAAQSALLYGYSLWGGIKEVTAAFLLALGVALAAILPRPPEGRRQLLPLAVAAGALIQTLGPGAGGWVAPALVLLAVGWPWRGDRRRRLWANVSSLAWLAGLTAAFVVPVWVVVGAFLSNKGGLFAGLFSSGQTQATRLGNLVHPLSVFQLAGIWPVGDFRLTAPTLPSALFVGLVLLAAAAALWLSARRRQFGVVLYVAVALIGCGVVYFSGGTPWVTGKALAISSPALLAAALTGGGMLWSLRGSHRAAGLAGVLVAGALAGGVVWSDVLAYSDVTLAPRARLAELQRIGELVAGKGPTFINEYEIYADRHFLRAGAPVEPAEYRFPDLSLRDGMLLTKSAAADLDSFPLSTLEPYRSIVTPRSPAESRPPSIYKLVWQGSYYQLWQRPAHPATRILEHVPLGESNTLPYCGNAQNGPAESLCSVDPVAIPACGQIQGLARQAAREHAQLVAYQRPAPIVARGDQTLWPGGWIHDIGEHSLTPTTPGQAVSHIAVASAQIYELWLGGSFSRGFEVSVDGRKVGTVKDELSSINGYVHLVNIFLAPGVHTFVLTYPQPNLTPGDSENELTSLNAIALEPQTPASELISVAPRQATQLCGRPLDWIEIVTGS
jgi:MFS family permease